MEIAVEMPTMTQQINNDDKHREDILNMNSENQQRWKDEAAADAHKWDQIMSQRQKMEAEERDHLRSNFMKNDTINRRKMLEKEGEMGRGAMMNGHLNHQGMHVMVPHPMLQQGMIPIYGRMPQMQQSPMVALPTTSAAANGAEEANTRKRASTTPSYEDRNKRIMMDNASTSNRFVYPQGSITDPKFPSHTQYPMANGGPYGIMPPRYNPPSCHMETAAVQQQQQQQQQAPLPQSALQMHPLSFPSPSTTSTVLHPSPMTLSSSTVPPSSSLPSHSTDGSKDDLDTLNTDNVDVMVNAVEGFSGEDLGGADLGLDEWTGSTSGSCATGGGPSSLPPHSNGGNRVILPPSTSSAPNSNRMPTPGGMDDMGMTAGSSSTHPSPINAFHPSPHQSYALNGLMNHVSSVGGPPDSGQSMPPLPPPRTPTTTVMGPPSDSSTPFPHMSHSSSLPPHLHNSFPMSCSSHTQPSLLQVPPSIPSTPAPKKKTKKAAAPKQSQPPPPQMSMQGMHPMFSSLPFPPSANQFAPPPGGIGAPPTQDMAAFGGNAVPSHPSLYNPQHMMMMRNHHQQQQMVMAMQQQQQQQQQMRQTGMAGPSTSSGGGAISSPQGGMIPQGSRPPMGISPAQSMMSPNMMMTPQQHMIMMQMQQQRMQHMRYQMQPLMDPQQMQYMQHQQQMQQMQQHQQQQMQQLQQQQSSGSGQSSPMMGGSAAQHGMGSQLVSSPLNASDARMSPAYTHTSAPFPFAGGHFPSINPSQ